MTDLWQSLKQRKLVQWALAYVAFSFALLQGVDIVAQRFAWPDSIERLLILALAVGFVIALVLAWYHGERGAQRVSGTEIVILALLLAIGGGLLWRFERASPSAGNPDIAQRTPREADATMQVIPAKSVAVLPLDNESGEKDQQYFSDGLSEDLITALSQFAGLKVISRDSSFHFRHSNDSSREIGAKLGVAHLLEGSVQKLGDEVRISAELVNAADGSTLWSQHYDRPYKDLFALQDDITKAVATALKAKLLDNGGAVPQSDRPPSGSLAAYNDVLQGRFYMQRNTEADLRKAIGYFGDATRLDPRYALAWAELGSANAILAGNYLGGSQAVQTWSKARAAVHTALSLDPNLALAHSVNVFILASADHDWARAEVEAQRAYQLAPDKGYFALAEMRGALGHAQQAVELLQHGLPTDPLCVVCYDYLARYLPALGRFDDAAQAERKALQLNPEYYFGRFQLTYVYAMRGDATAALQAAQQQPPGNWRDMAVALALQLGGKQATADAPLPKVIAGQAGYAAYQIAEIYALRRDPDDMFKWLERANQNRDPGITLLLTDPPVLRYKNDPRFVAFCKKVGLPTTTDAKAMP
ncbi:MAG: tetratricopeptide repeat protein [Rhodanobacteraceae bacterium]